MSSLVSGDITGEGGALIMLEMAGGAICLSTMGLKIGNCVCSADKWRKAVRYVRATTEQPIWSKKEESTPMLYRIGQGFHNRTHA